MSRMLPEALESLRYPFHRGSSKIFTPGLLTPCVLSEQTSDATLLYRWLVGVSIDGGITEECCFEATLRAPTMVGCHRYTGR